MYFLGGGTQEKRGQTSMSRVGFETTIPVFERARTFHASDRGATLIGCPLPRYSDIRWGCLGRRCRRIWRMLKYSEMSNIFICTSRLIVRGRMKWMGHVARMVGMRIATLRARDYLGNLGAGGMMTLKRVYWIQLAQDKLNGCCLWIRFLENWEFLN
jgi:hypothetical protein